MSFMKQKKLYQINIKNSQNLISQKIQIDTILLKKNQIKCNAITMGRFQNERICPVLSFKNF